MIQNAFGPNGFPQPEPEQFRDVEKSTGIDDDFEASRKNLIRMMDTTMGAIRSLSIIAHQSQMPDAYDVLNKLIKTYNEQQEQLIRFYRIKESKEAAKKPQPANGTIAEIVDNRTQNVFVGSPADLARVLDGMKKED